MHHLTSLTSDRENNRINITNNPTSDGGIEGGGGLIPYQPGPSNSHHPPPVYYPQNPVHAPGMYCYIVQLLVLHFPHTTYLNSAPFRSSSFWGPVLASVKFQKLGFLYSTLLKLEIFVNKNRKTSTTPLKKRSKLSFFLELFTFLENASWSLRFSFFNRRC